MKNLENFGVQEMNTQEIKEIEGGIFLAIAFAILVVAAPMIGWQSGRKALGQP